MNSQTKIFNKIVSYLEESLKKAPFDIGDGYGAEWQFKNDIILTILDDDTIFINCYQKETGESIYEATVSVYGSGDFDVFGKYNEKVAEAIEVNFGEKSGFKELGQEFDLTKTDLPELVRVLKQYI